MLFLGPDKRKDEYCASVVAGRKDLTRYTGYGKRTLDSAIRELERANLIETERRRKRDKYDTILAGAIPNRYYLGNPDDKGSGCLEPKGEINILPTNGIRYFTMPEVVVSKYEQPWALANLKSGEIRLYVTALWLANKSRLNTFEIATAKLRSMARITDKRSFSKTLDRLTTLGLLTFDRLLTTTRNSADLQITLSDPTTGEPVIQASENPTDNPANYYVENLRGAARLILNMGTEDDREKLLKSFLPPNAHTIKQEKGDITIVCPYHDDKWPSCSVSTRIRCFNCFACGKKGTLLELLTKLKGGDTAATMYKIAADRGQSVTFRDPDASAEAIYSYLDEHGNLLKQVLRYADHEQGRKKIRQRRLGKSGGWVWNTQGLGPLLYHRELLNNADVVIVTEGEKDADTVTRLELTSSNYKRIVGVTSGGSDSWDNSLAEQFAGKRVVVMPDADAAGEKFGAAVTESLNDQGIDYKVVTFAEDNCKDVSDFMKEHSSQELAERIGDDWVIIRKSVDHDVEILI